MDDDESIDKNTLYHEPFNVNMYTSAASGCSLNDLQRQHITPDYTDVPDIVCQEYAVPNIQELIPKLPPDVYSTSLSINNHNNHHHTSNHNNQPQIPPPPPPLSSNNIFSRTPVPLPPPETKYYATSTICSKSANSGAMMPTLNKTSSSATLSASSVAAASSQPYYDCSGGINGASSKSASDLLQIREFSRHSLVIIEKLGVGIFGEMHLCETKDLR